MPERASGTEAVTTARVSVTHTGAQADRPSGSPALSSDGRYVAFVSDSAHIVQGDTNNAVDVFLHDRRTGAQRRISVSSSGTESRFTDPTKAPNASPAVTAGGRFVAFSSGAWNLAAGDTNELADIFVRDHIAGTTVRASIGLAGAQPNGHSTKPAISDDGRFVAFESAASNLVANDSNGAPDIFVRDLQLGTTQRVSVRWDGLEVPRGGYGVPAISGDGRFVAFHSVERLHPYDQNGIVDVYVRDREAPSPEPVSLDVNGNFGNGNTWDDIAVGDPVISMSPDARYVAFESGTPTLVPGDTNVARDVFVRDRTAASTRRVSVGSTGRQLSGPSRTPSISDDGRYVGFVSDAADAVAGDTNAAADVFVHDTATNTTARVSVSSGGGQADGASPAAAISGDGTATAFASLARNLVPSDTNNVQDVFVRGAPLPVPPPTPVITTPSQGATVRSSTVTFAGTAALGTTVEVLEGAVVVASGITQADGTWTAAATLPDGDHSVVAIASANGADSDPTPLRTFIVDTSTPPVSPPVISKPGHGSLTNVTTITATGSSDPHVTITLTEGTTTLGSTVAGADGLWSLMFTATEGQHTIVATASNGTLEASSAPRTFTVDLTPPAAPQIVSPAPGEVVYRSPVTVAGTTEPKATVYVYWESFLSGTVVASANGSWSKSVSMSEGQNELVVRARDQAGNLGGFSEPYVVTLEPDDTPPVISFTTPAYHAYIPGTPSAVEGLAQDNTKVVAVEVVIRTLQNTQVAVPPVTCSGCGTAQATWSASPSLQPGVYRVFAYAYDAAGLRSAQNFITVVRT